MWICPLVGLGYYLSHTKLAARSESQFLSIILCLPLVLLVGSLIALVWRWLQERQGPRLKGLRQIAGYAGRRPFFMEIVTNSAFSLL